MNGKENLAKNNYWLQVLGLIIYAIAILFLITGLFTLDRQINLGTIGAVLIIISFTIRWIKYSKKIIDKQNKTNLKQQKNEQITSQNTTIFSYSIQIGTVLLIIFCLLSYFAFEKNYHFVCLDMERVNNIAILIFGTNSLIESIEDASATTYGKLFSKISQSIFIIFAILYLPLMFFGPIFC